MEKIEELSEASKVPLKHMLKIHDNCSAEWCFKTRATEEGKTYNERDNEFRCKQNNNQSYVDWCALSDKDKHNNKVKLTVTYDMDWQKISSGRRYDSSSGHAFIIGGRSKGIIGMVLYYEACRKCDSAENRGEEAEEHE